MSVEGEKTKVECKGPLGPVVKKFLGSLASGMTYIGARNMKSLVGKADFIEITNSGMEESRANGVSQ